MLRVVQFLVGGYDNNVSYVIHDDESKVTAIVDPTGDIRKLRQFVDDAEMKVQHVLLTHTHRDHLEALEEVRKSYNVTVWVHEDIKKKFKDKSIKGVEDDDDIVIGTAQLKVMHTPGHSPDSVCYFVPLQQSVTERPLLISGDTLFVGGCGRTTAAGVEDLYDSLQRLKQLTPDTEVYPGHHYGHTMTSTIGYECEHNKYLLAPDFESFRNLRLET